MTAQGDRRLAAVLGILGAVLIALDGLLDLARGVFYVVVGRGDHAYLPFDQALIFFVVGLLVGVFAAMGASREEERALLVGVVLIVIVIVGWLTLGFGSGVLAILGALLVLLAGVIFLVTGR